MRKPMLYLVAFNLVLDTYVNMELITERDGCDELKFDESRCVCDIQCNGYIRLSPYTCSYQQPHEQCTSIFYNGREYNPIYVKFHKTYRDIEDGMSLIVDYGANMIYSVDISNNELTDNLHKMPIMDNLAKLNMSRNGLTEAKLSARNEFKRITEIDFSHNTIHIINVQSDEYVFKNLKVLYVSYNYLVTIPDAIFDAFSELQTLDLSHNFIDTLNIITFEGLKKLLYLYLSYNRIADLNSSLLRFNELVELDLSHNRIENIKMQDFERLTKLQKLDLSSNSILGIEKNVFFKMIFLNSIDLSNNVLQTLDKESFSNVSSLNQINLSKNNIKTLPKGLFKGKNINIYSIKDNSLEGALTRGIFEGLEMVTELDLSNQQLTSVEDLAFSGLERLEMLLLNNNKIVSMSKLALSTLKNLNLLDLSNNHITNIEFEKGELLRLRSFILRNNLITKVKHEYFSTLNMLQFLDLSNNKITHLESSSFKPLNDLINFQISNNPISGTLEENTFDGFNSLPSLDISRTLLTLVKNGTFNGMFQLKDLNISHSNISELQFNSFINTGVIETIDLSFNHLTYFNLNTSELVNLITLILRNNLLTTISCHSLKGLPRLNKVILSYNNIDIIHKDAFLDQSDLRILDLSHNTKLKFNISQIEKAQNFFGLYLSGIQNNITFKNIDFVRIFELHMSYAKIKNISTLELKKLKDLDTLVLSNNDIVNVSNGAFSNVSLLRHLDLSFNKISFIQPGVFKDNTILHTLNISHNMLTTIGYGIFRGLIFLHTVDMSYNDIDNLQSERFYEVRSLSVLIADHNKINSVNADDFAGTSLLELSIGDNPLPCDVLVKLKNNMNRFAVTALMLDESSNENIDGVTCNMNNSKPKIKSPSDIFENDEILADIRDILRNLFTINKNEKAQVSENNNPHYIDNIINQIEKSDEKYNTTLLQLNNLTFNILDENKNTNALLDKMLNILSTMNVKRSPPIPIPKENSSVESFIPYINKIKQDLEDTIALEKQNILNEVETKIAAIDSHKKTSVTIGPSQGALTANDASEKNPFIFMNTCVALILVVLVLYYLYKVYNSGIFVTSRRSQSTRHLPDAMENSTL